MFSARPQANTRRRCRSEADDLHQCPANYRKRASEARVRYLYPYRFMQNLITTPFRRWSRALVTVVLFSMEPDTPPRTPSRRSQIGAPGLRARPIDGRGRRSGVGSSPALRRYRLRPEYEQIPEHGHKKTPRAGLPGCWSGGCVVSGSTHDELRMQRPCGLEALQDVDHVTR